jgi:hypothetical protein
MKIKREEITALAIFKPTLYAAFFHSKIFYLEIKQTNLVKSNLFVSSLKLLNHKNKKPTLFLSLEQISLFLFD